MPTRARWYTAREHVLAPPDFSFWRTAYSHGWCDLPPFAFDPVRRTLSRIVEPFPGILIHCTLAEASHGVTIALRSGSPITTPVKRAVSGQIRSCLRLDEDFRAFHLAARRNPRFRWIASSRSGRMLRAPTLFEDSVKMICTTNCNWALTRAMISNIVRVAGRRFDDGLFSFPQPSALSALTERDLRSEVKAGYRAPYLLELADRVASGALDLEQWRSSPLSSEDLLAQLMTIKGIGPYAGQNLLKLLGRYDRLGLDSWVRGRFSRLYARGQRVKDKTIERHYAEFGGWRGLFFWLEMTRDWHDGNARHPDLAR